MNNTTQPKIDAGNQNLPEITEKAWFALLKANDPPYLFRHGDSIVRLESDENETLRLRSLNNDHVRYELARVANWYRRKNEKQGQESHEDAKPPLDVVKDLLATPDYPLPILSRITEVPVFASNGQLQTKPGYHAAARIYYSPAKGFSLPDVTDNPTPEGIEKARTLLLDDLLFDFPFVDNADRAHAIALFLVPFARDLIEGSTPCHLIEAPTPGSGKGLLADVVLRPAVGKHIGIVTQAHDGDEFRKRITAQLRELQEVILIDNINKPLDSGELAAALTAPIWQDRLLGSSHTVSFPVRCIWVCTANNPVMSTEIARRCIRIRIDPGVDHPWLSTIEYKHPDLRAWTDNHRGELVWSALVLIKAWLAAGKPLPNCKPLGSFEDWSRVIGGILENAGISGFLTNLNEFYEASDIEGTLWREFIEDWWEKYGSKKVSVADLFDLATEHDGFELSGNSDRSQRISFGKQLARQRDRVIGGYRIVEAGKKQRAKLWQLIPLSPKESDQGDKGE